MRATFWHGRWVLKGMQRGQSSRQVGQISVCKLAVAPCVMASCLMSCHFRTWCAQLVLEMRKTTMLDVHLGETGSLLGTTRNTMGGIYAAKEMSVAAQKKIKLLENRLEKAYIKYNQSITHNKQLREQINNLRRERIMFEGININLERELQRLKKDMAETIQMANTAFEAKEKALGEMNVLKVQADREHAGFEEEWKQLTAIIEEDKRERVRSLSISTHAAAHAACMHAHRDMHKSGDSAWHARSSMQ